MNWLNDLWNKATNTFDKWIDVEVGRYTAKRSITPSVGGDPFGAASPYPTSTGGQGLSGNTLAFIALVGLAAVFVLKK